MIRGGPNPNAGRPFVNCLVSREGQMHFARDGLPIATGGMEDMVPPELHWLVFARLLGRAGFETPPARPIRADEIRGGR